MKKKDVVFKQAMVISLSLNENLVSYMRCSFSVANNPREVPATGFHMYSNLEISLKEWKLHYIYDGSSLLDSV